MPLNCFHSNKSTHDGLRNYCKVCTRKYRNDRYKNKKDRIVSIPYAQKTEEQKQKMRESIKKHRIKNKVKTMARSAVFIAVRSGRIIKPKYCATCGMDLPLECHHWKGYSPKYFTDVIWLCKKCHGAHDRLMRSLPIWPYDYLSIVDKHPY